MLHVSSRQNSLYKQLLRLSQGKRDSIPLDINAPATAVHQRNTAVLLEGVHLCQEWLRHRGQPFRAVFDSRQLDTEPELQALVSELDPATACSMDGSLLKSLSHIAASQGVLFLAHTANADIPPRIQRSCLWLDRIQDPGNVGTLLRTAAAAGVRDVYFSDGCAQAWSPRVLRSAQGAHFSLTLYEHVNLHKAAVRLSIPLYATALGPDAVCLYDVQMANECAWIFGNEGQGVDTALLALAQHKVFIPQDPSVESLNVAVAAGICLFEQRRRLAVAVL